jgi:hypothetical protein
VSLERDSLESGGSDVEMEAALAGVPLPAARAEFREALRSRFLGTDHEIAREAHPHGASPTSASPWRGRGRLFRLGGLLAAAGVLLIGYLMLRPADSNWRVLRIADGLVVRVDGVRVPAHDPLALARRLGAAKEIEIEQGRLVVKVGDLALFDLVAGTRAVFEGFASGDNSQALRVQALSGRLRARTGPAFRGRQMLVHADVLDVSITGTAFAIDYESEGTCVCCLHGEVLVTSNALGPDPKPVPPQRMCLVFRDAHEPMWGGPPDDHAAPLIDLEARAAEIWP